MIDSWVILYTWHCQYVSITFIQNIQKLNLVPMTEYKKMIRHLTTLITSLTSPSLSAWGKSFLILFYEHSSAKTSLSSFVVIIPTKSSIAVTCSMWTSSFKSGRVNSFPSAKSKQSISIALSSLSYVNKHTLISESKVIIMNNNNNDIAKQQQQQLQY